MPLSADPACLTGRQCLEIVSQLFDGRDVRLFYPEQFEHFGGVTIIYCVCGAVIVSRIPHLRRHWNKLVEIERGSASRIVPGNKLAKTSKIFGGTIHTKTY